MSLTNARIQIVLGWILMITGAVASPTMSPNIGLAIWGIGAFLLIIVSVLYIVSKTGGGRLGGA